MMGMVKKWMEELKGKWERMEERMEDRMTVLMVELENMRKREEAWGEEKKRMEKRIGELEKKWEKGQWQEGRREKIEELEKRLKRLECGGGEERERGDTGRAEIEERMGGAIGREKEQEGEGDWEDVDGDKERDRGNRSGKRRANGGPDGRESTSRREDMENNGGL
ncbi:prothymosin alpha-like [Solenopsis invicta]|uniref:prothymosin alpha-like n=1 Tax=Solenopsis invicta TaxID=13686 RepID=UPI000E3402FA|nr:prothymosin alpha-like [Solenopsis invicta]